VASSKRHVPRPGQALAGARRLAGEDQQTVVAPPGDRDRGSAQLVRSGEVVVVKRGERVGERGRRPAVIEGGHRFGRRHPRWPPEGLLEERRAPGSGGGDGADGRSHRLREAAEHPERELAEAALGRTPEPGG
jgi:hypothetical protein